MSKGSDAQNLSSKEQIAVKADHIVEQNRSIQAASIDSITEFCYNNIMYLKHKDSITVKYYLSFVVPKVQTC
jgi:hypothetical protein